MLRSLGRRVWSERTMGEGERVRGGPEIGWARRGLFRSRKRRSRKVLRVTRARRGVLVGFVLALCGVAAALGFGVGNSGAAAPFKAAFIYVGPHADGGWSQAHDEGRMYAQKMLGSAVQTTYKGNVA